MLLPSLGGTPSVWNTSMVFFQTALVAGYALAHAGRRLLSARSQRIAQVVALAVPVLTLPVALPGGWDPPAEGSPAIWLLAALGVMVGLPFLMLSTCSPTLQHWFATGRGTHGRDPYFLYAAGNAGSLIALLAYPVLIEPRLSLSGQARLFSVGYVALVLLSAACAARGSSAASGDGGGRAGRGDDHVEPAGPLAGVVLRAVRAAARRHPAPHHRRDVGADALDRAAHAVPAHLHPRLRSSP